YLGGGSLGYGGNQGNGIALDLSGNVYVAGSTSTPDFPTFNALQQQLNGFSNAFVTKLLNQPSPGIAVAPMSIDFGGVVVGGKSSSQTITVTNNGVAPLVLSGIEANDVTYPAHDFSQTNNCSQAIAPSANCTIQATYAPSQPNSESGVLIILNNALLVPEVIPLSGVGQSFSLQGSPSTQTVSPGQDATFALTVGPVDGFNQQVSLACSGSPAGTNCSISPPKVTLDGKNPSNATLTVKTTASSAMIGNANLFQRSLAASVNSRWPLLLEWVGMVTIVLLPQARTRFHGDIRARTIALVVTYFAFAFVPACGGGATGGGNSRSGGNGGTGGSTPTIYTITVTAAPTSTPTAMQTTQFTVTVSGS
ncbi:MAG TPA: choice-of-anchor D domain-containing protein, partial [Terriglobales bacterium]|nr:choice-of-anchor D domain-containing protein [Terriglobales bacterium]